MRQNTCAADLVRFREIDAFYSSRMIWQFVAGAGFAAGCAIGWAVR